MIYFLDNDLQLQKIVTSKNIYETNHEHELNGYIIADVLLPLDYVKEFIDKVEYFGYYYRGTFYLHKIQSTEYLHQDDVCLISGRHIFFDDMLYGKLIEDVRPQNRNALDILNNTIAMNSRWRPQLVDTTGTLSTNFYWQPMFDVIDFVNKEFRLDFLPKVLFDGQKINGFDIEFAEKIGNDTAIRIPFGYRTLELTHEIDYSEIVTKLVVHGKGEEVGDGYGRRINISDVDFSRNGVKSPKGSLYLEDESLTATYGNDGQTPREGREVFEDIENVNDLAEAGYNLYQELSRPRMAFEAKVADIGDVGIGDSVMIIRREHNLYFKARIHKVKVDLFNPDDAEVELGDYEFFKETKAERRSRKDDEAYKRRNTSMIEELKRQFDVDFNDRVNQFRQEFEQAKIDIFAEIEADRVNMQNLLDTKSAEWTENFNQSVAESKEYAEQQAQVKAAEVKTALEIVTSSHQKMLEELETDVMSIDNFLGPKDRTLQSILDNQREELEQKIEVYNRRYPNLVIGSTLENIDGFESFGTSTIELRTDESLNYIRTYGDGNVSAHYYPDTVFLEQGKTYTIGVDFRSDVVNDLDYIYFLYQGTSVPLNPMAQARNLTADGEWHRYYFTFDWINTTRRAQFLLGTDYRYGDVDKGWFDTRQVHIYEGDVHNIPWSPSPSDNAQIVSQLLYEVNRLDDGMKSLATKTELDLVTGNVRQLTNDFTSTSEQVSSKLQNFDDVLGVNGSHFTQISEQVQSKVWLNDLTNINPNLIPFSDTGDVNNLEKWTQFSSSYTTTSLHFDREIHVQNNGGSYVAVQSEAFLINEGTHTLSFIGRTSIPWNTSGLFTYTYLINENGNNIHLGRADATQSIDETRVRHTWNIDVPFTGNARVLIGTTKSQAGILGRMSFSEPKLERGSERTPFLNAFSNIEQLANKIALQVQDLDGEYLSQSDLQITPNYWQLGATRIGPENVSSVLRGSPDALDAVVSNFNLTGNLNAKGQITTLAVDAIEGNFARLFANQLTANVITSDHIQVGTALVEKLFATSARIDVLIGKDYFVNNVTAMTVNAVEGQFSSLMAKYLNVNYIDVDYINGKNAWFESQYTLNANIAKLTAQHAFIRDVQAIEITANQLNIQTLHSKLKSVEGGLTIYGPDGRVLINNSMLRASFDVQVYDAYGGNNVEFAGLNYYTSSSFWQTFKYFYTDFKGSQLLVSWAVGLQSGNSASEYAEVQVRGFGGNNPIGSRSSRQFVKPGETTYHNQIINLGVPDYSTIQGYLEFRRSPTGVSMNNTVYARVLRVSLIN